MIPEDYKDSNDTVEAINKVRTDFRLQSCQFLMTMCNDIGDGIETCADVDVKHKLKMVECRNALLLMVEDIHQKEQKDTEKIKKTIRKNRAYRKIRFNETELKMLEEVVELKNDPNNKFISSEKKKQNSKKQKKSFISRAGNEQNHKNYKEFVNAKQEEFNKNKSKIIADYKHNLTRKPSSRVLPPITPRELTNLTEFEEIDKTQTTKQSETPKIIPKQLISDSHQEMVEVKQEDLQKKPLRRFQIGNSITLKGQMKELRKLKKIKLNDLNHGTKYNNNTIYREQICLPGQL